MVLIHILLTILKILGILILAILGLILLAVLCLLFVPVTYAARGKKTGDDLEGSVRIAWLFGGLSGTVWYRDKRKGFEIRVLGIPILRLRRWLQARKKEKSSAGEKIRIGGDDRPAAPVKTEEEKTEKEKAEKEKTEKEKAEKKKTENTENPRERLSSQPSQQKAGPSEEGRGRKETVPPKEPDPAMSSEKEQTPGLLRRILSVPRRLVEKIRKIRLTIREICDRIRRWKDFLTLDTTKRAVKFLLGTGRDLLRHILPRKVRGDITVGFDDPSVTGRVLAAAGVLYPLYKENVQITPVFDRKILEGELRIRGRIFGAMFLWTAWKVYRNRDIRTTWKGFQNKEA